MCVSPGQLLWISSESIPRTLWGFGARKARNCIYPRWIHSSDPPSPAAPVPPHCTTFPQPRAGQREFTEGVRGGVRFLETPGYPKVLAGEVPLLNSTSREYWGPHKIAFYRQDGTPSVTDYTPWITVPISSLSVDILVILLFFFQQLQRSSLIIWMHLASTRRCQTKQKPFVPMHRTPWISSVHYLTLGCVSSHATVFCFQSKAGRCTLHWINTSLSAASKCWRFISNK